MTELIRRITAIFMMLYMTVLGWFGFQKNIDCDLQVVLNANPSTGCSWEVKTDREGIVELIDSSYEQTVKDPFIVGAGGKETFCFNAVGEGEVTIDFSYGRHWEGGEIFRTVVYHCNASDGKITVLSITDSDK